MNITYNQAAERLSAAIKKAKSLQVSVSIAVVDDSGHLMTFARLDGVYGVIDIAVKKAKTAVMFGIDNDIMGTVIADAKIHGYGLMNSNNGLITIAGGIAIKNSDGCVIGAIGTSGGTPEQDKEVSLAGAGAISLS